MTVDSEARRDEMHVKRLFNASHMLAENFYVHQLPDMGTWAEVIFEPCGSSPGEPENILQAKYMREIKVFHDYILANTHVTLNDSSKRRVNFDQVCARRDGSCLVDGASLLDPEFYKKWLREAMEARTRKEEEAKELGKAFSSAKDADERDDGGESQPRDDGGVVSADDEEQSANGPVNEFMFYVRFTEKGAAITDLTFNLGICFRATSFECIIILICLLYL